MPPSEATTPADVGDRHRHLLAFSLLAIGAIYAVSAATHLTGETAAVYLDWVQIGGAGVAVLLLVPIFGWKLRHRSADMRHLYFSPEGFVAETVRKAQQASWVTTFVLVILLASFDETIANLGLPPEFFLEGIVGVMAGVFGAVFLVLNRVESRDGMDEIEDLSDA